MFNIIILQNHASVNKLCNLIKYAIYHQHSENQIKLSLLYIFLALKNLPEVNQDVGWMDSFTVSLKKGKRGYGFTVTGSCPVKVGQVKDGSPAHEAGLEKEDTVVKINGKNVSRSIADTVAKIIRNSEHEVILELYRPFDPAEHGSNDQCVPSSSAAHIKSPNRSQSSEKQEQGLWSPYSPPPHLYSPGSPCQMVPNDSPPAKNASPSHECGSPIKSLPSEFSSFRHSPPCKYNIEAEVHEVPGACGGGVYATRAINLDEWQEDEPFQRASTPTGLRTMSFLDLSDEEQGRQEAIAGLKRTEQKFVQGMQFGIERYLQRLRYSLISPQQHATLFQNIEKVTLK